MKMKVKSIVSDLDKYRSKQLDNIQAVFINKTLINKDISSLKSNQKIEKSFVGI